MADDAFAATLDPRIAPQGDALTARPAADPLDADYRQNIEDVRRSMTAEQEIARERNAALAGPRADVARMSRQPMPQPPAAQPLPPVPKRNDPGADESWLMAASVLGAIAGGLTRRHVTNALAAMTGAMEGYTEGSKEKFQQQLAQWKAEGEKAREANQAADTRYKQILESRKLAIEEKLQAIELTAAQYQDRAAMQLAQTRNLETLGRLIEQRSQHQERMAAAAARIKQQYDQMQQRERLAQERNAATLEAAKLRAGSQNQQSNEAIDLRVERALAGDPNATRGMSVRGPDWARFSDRLAEVAKERGLSAEDIRRLQLQYTGEQSYQRTAGGMSARVENAVNEVQQLLPQALEASRNLPRGKFVPYNRLVQAAEAGTSDPRYNDFLLANFSLEKAYGRAMNPQGVPRVTEELEAKARGVLSMATNQQAYEVQLRRLWLEVQASKRATAATRFESVTPQALSPDNPIPPMPGATPSPERSNRTSTGVEWSVQP